MFDAGQVYLPAEDSFLLRDVVLSEVRSCDVVLEVGVGSGFVSAAAVSLGARVLGCDINPHAVLYAREVYGVEVVRCDLFCGISGRFDVILFNAPYLPTSPEERVDDWLEFALDGGVSGRETVNRFVAEAGSHLLEGGRVLLLISSLTGVDEVVGFARGCGFCVSCVRCEREEDGEELFVLRLVLRG